MGDLPSYFNGLVGQDAVSIDHLVSTAGGVDVTLLNKYVTPGTTSVEGKSSGAKSRYGLSRLASFAMDKLGRGEPEPSVEVTGTKYVYLLDAVPPAKNPQDLKPQRFIYYVDAKHADKFLLGTFPGMLKSQIDSLVKDGYTVNTYTADVNGKGKVENLEHHMIYDKANPQGMRTWAGRMRRPAAAVSVDTTPYVDHSLGKGGSNTGRTN